jgi:hypothetical protein
VLGADHLFDFTDDPVGQQPAYVSTPWQQTGVQVVATDWATDGRALQIDPYGTSAFFAAVFDPVPAAADVELVARIRDLGPQSGWDWMSGVGTRITGTGQAGNGVLTQTKDGTHGLVLSPLRQGNFSGFQTYPLERGDYLKTRTIGDQIATKLWSGTLADEPSDWQVEHTLPGNPIGAGNTAITRYFGQHTTQLDYLAVTILDTPDPNPNPNPEPDPDPDPSGPAAGEAVVLGADHLFDFTDDPVGQQPAYVSTPWQQTGVQVVATDWATDGRALQIDPYGTSAFFAAVFDPVPAAADVELVARIRDLGPQSGWDWMSGVGTRITGTGQAGNGVLTQTKDGTHGLVLSPLRQGNFSGFQTYPLERGDYLKTRTIGDQIATKLWSGTLADEPSDWTVEHTLPGNPIGAGNTAITRYFGQHTTQLDYLAVTILDTPDPNPNPNPEPDPDPDPSGPAAGEAVVLGADHLFDFTDDPIGQQPAYVSTPWQQTGVQVVATDWATDGRALQIDPYGTSAFFAAVFDPVPAAADVELVARIRDLGPQSGWDWMSGVGTRITGTGQAGNGVLTQTKDGTHGLVLSPLRQGNFSGFQTYPLERGDYLKTRTIGDQIATKLWSGTLADEPSDWHRRTHPARQPHRRGQHRHHPLLRATHHPTRLPRRHHPRHPRPQPRTRTRTRPGPGPGPVRAGGG